MAALAVNHRALIVIGSLAVLLAVAIGAILLTINKTRHPRRTKWLTRIGLVSLVLGIGVAGYTALIAPGIAKAPNIDVTLTKSSGQFILNAHVTASGIKENSPYWIEVDAREYVASGKSGRYVALGTPLYQSQLGADGQGNIDSNVTIPLPVDPLSVVSIEGWDGPHPGPCGSLGVEGGANLTQSLETEAELEKYSRPGCVVIRLPR